MAKAKSKTPKVVETFAECAKHFGVAIRTVQRWVEMDCPRRADGSFDLAAIEAWRASLKKSSVTDGDAAAERLAILRLEKRARLLDVEERTGELVEVERVSGLVERHVSAAVAQLRQLPDEVFSLLPEGADKALIRKHVEARVKRACDEIAAALDDWAWELETGAAGDDSDPEAA